MNEGIPTLPELGWSNRFQSNLTADEWETVTPARVMAVHRSGADLATAIGEVRGLHFAGDGDEDHPTVGDWVLLDESGQRIARILERSSLFKRRAPGSDRRIQLIAANVDTLFVVSSCNLDFNIARLERYLTIAREAEVTPVIVLTKADEADDAAEFAAMARALAPGLMVETLDARDRREVGVLEAWCGSGQTVALVGSSGVGKTTLVNTLIGGDLATAAIRADDAKGRHTTTGRSMHRLAAGGWVIDTPGMRELQLVDVEEGLAETFADVTELAAQCRFADCTHQSEPGCAVSAAVETGALDPDRLKRYRKLAAEEARNRQAVHERRASDKRFGKMVKSIMAEKRGRGGS